MNLSNRIKNFDKSNMLNLLLSFPDQFQQGIEIGKAFDFKIEVKKIKQIVHAGMGGSAIGGDLIFSYLQDELTIPFAVNRGYFLPSYLNQSSLVIISSFSGNTEESLSCYEDARSRNAQILCITSGGELAQKARQDKIPMITIPGKMQPRAALGYLTLPILVALIKANLALLEKANFDETLALLKAKAQAYSPQCPENEALVLARKLYNKVPVIYCANDLLAVVANRWKCQLSENAKTVSFSNVFPELNHNEIAGWQIPEKMLKKFQIIYLKDRFDFSRNQSRMVITKNILEAITNPIIEISTEGNSSLTRLFSLIYLGDWVSFYLAMLNKVDPTPIEKIQRLKDELNKIS